MTDEYKNVITWTDRSTTETGHVITRTRLSDGVTTQIANLSSAPVHNSMGVMQFVDDEQLVPGDYRYTVQNYTPSGMIGSGVPGDQANDSSNVVDVTIIDQTKHHLCMALSENFTDSTNTHTSLTGDNVSFGDSGGQFNNSHITMSTEINILNNFTISCTVIPAETRSTDGVLITSYNDTHHNCSVILTTDNRVRFVYTGHDNNEYSVETTVDTVVAGASNTVFITGDTNTGNLDIHVNQELVNRSTSYTGMRVRTGNMMRIGKNQTGDKFYTGVLHDVSVILDQVMIPTRCLVCPPIPEPIESPTQVSLTYNTPEYSTYLSPHIDSTQYNPPVYTTYTSPLITSTTYTPLLLPSPIEISECDHIVLHIESDTTDTSAAIIDMSDNSHTIYTRGGPYHQTDVKLFGDSSLRIEPQYTTGDAFYSTATEHLTGDFTVESWLNADDHGEIPTTLQLPGERSTVDTHITGELLHITQDTTLTYTNDRVSAITADTVTLTTLNGTDFNVNQRVLIITTFTKIEADVDTAGNYEFAEIDSISADTLTLKNSLQQSYSTTSYTWIVAMPRYDKIIIDQNVNVTVAAWSGSTSSIAGVVILSANEIEINGTVSADNTGFRGGYRDIFGNQHGQAGETFLHGIRNTYIGDGRYGSGGAGLYVSNGSAGDVGVSGGGGGHGTRGGNGKWAWNIYQAQGGQIISPDHDTVESKIFMGPGGGMGASDRDNSTSRGGFGGNGGGIVIIDSDNCSISSTGMVTSNATPGLPATDFGNGEPGNGGGGAGGTVIFTGDVDNYGLVEARFGSRGYTGEYGQGGGWGYTGGRGGDGIVAWFGDLRGNFPVNTTGAIDGQLTNTTGDLIPTDYHQFRNITFMIDCRSHTHEDSVGGEFGMLIVPKRDSTKYDIAYGAFGESFQNVPADIDYGQWHHIAVSRKTGSEVCYVNGVTKSTRDHASTYSNTHVNIGSQSLNYFANPNTMTGYVQGVRISTKAMYTGNNFIVPDTFYPSCV